MCVYVCVYVCVCVCVCVRACVRVRARVRRHTRVHIQPDTNGLASPSSLAGTLLGWTPKASRMATPAIYLYICFSVYHSFWLGSESFPDHPTFASTYTL